MSCLRHGRIAAFGFIALTAGAAASQAAGDPNAAKGLIAEHCASCHAVPGYSQEGLATLEAPSFADIAGSPEIYDSGRLRASLRQPHWPMGQFRLSAQDIDNVMAFIASLRPPAN